jgi:hypothetical protein
MADDREKEELAKGFSVKDRRFSARKEEESPSAKEETQKEVPKRAESQREEALGDDAPLPPITFPNFILSLSTSALIQLGEVEDPVTNRITKNLPLAKQTIDLLGMLKEKTKGNLSSDEERLMDHILYDLRMRYVKAVG